MENNLKPTTYKVSDRGVVQIAQLHDAEIISIDLGGKRPNRIVIKLQTEAGSEVLLLLKDIHFLATNNFSTQNVISEVAFLKGMDAKAGVKEIAEYLQKNSPNDLDHLAGEIKEGRTGLFYITPSLGCEVICLCKELEVFVR